MKAFRESATREAIEEQRKACIQADQEVARARDALAQAEKIAAEMQSALSWHELIRKLNHDPAAVEVKRRFDAAFAVFEKTLTAPDGYEQDSDGIPFCDTDDFADFSAVEQTIDEVLDEVTGVIAAHAPSNGSFSSNGSAPAPSSGALLKGASSKGQKKQTQAEISTDAAALAEVERARLMLLSLTVAFAERYDVFAANAQSVDHEEARDSIVEAWSSALLPGGLDTKLWVTVFEQLRSPFDSLASEVLAAASNDRGSAAA